MCIMCLQCFVASKSSQRTRMAQACCAVRGQASRCEYRIFVVVKLHFNCVYCVWISVERARACRSKIDIDLCTDYQYVHGGCTDSWPSNGLWQTVHAVGGVCKVLWESQSNRRRKSLQPCCDNISFVICCIYWCNENLVVTCNALYVPL